MKLLEWVLDFYYFSTSARSWISMRCSSALCQIEVALTPSSLFASLDKVHHCQQTVLVCLYTPWEHLLLCAKERLVVSLEEVQCQQIDCACHSGHVPQCLSHEWVHGEYSEEFGMGVVVHQGCVLSPLSFISLLKKSRKHSCAACPSGAVTTSSLCLQCKRWVYKRFSGISGWLAAHICVMTRLGPSAAEQWLKWMSMVPCLRWKPLSVPWRGHTVIQWGLWQCHCHQELHGLGKFQEILACPYHHPPPT